MTNLSAKGNGNHSVLTDDAPRLNGSRLDHSIIVKDQKYEVTMTEIQNQYNQNLLDNLYPRLRTNTTNLGLLDSNLPERVERAKSELSKQNWFIRTFSPLTPGSLRGSIITLMSTALGSGILSLPYVVAETGLVIGSLFIIFGALIALMSMYLLMKASFKTGISKYSDLVKSSFGDRWSLFFELMLITYAFGTITAYQVTISSFVPEIFENLGIISQASFDFYEKGIQVLTVAILAFPIALIRNLYGLRYGTILGVFSVLYILVVVVIQSFWTIPYQFNPGDNITVQPTITDFNQSLVSSFAMTIFAYTCHTNIFPIRVELSHPLETRMRKIFKRAVFVELCMYLSMAILGYLSMMDHPVQLITNRIPPPSFPKSDPFMLVGRIAMTFNLIIALPVNISPCRIQISNMLNDKEYNRNRHILITFVLLFGSAALAWVYPGVASAFGVLGGTCSTMLSITFPIAIYVKTSPDSWKRPLNLFMVTLAVILTGLGFAGAVVSVGFQVTPRSACSSCS